MWVQPELAKEHQQELLREAELQHLPEQAKNISPETYRAFLNRLIGK